MRTRSATADSGRPKRRRAFRHSLPVERDAALLLPYEPHVPLAVVVPDRELLQEVALLRVQAVLTRDLDVLLRLQRDVPDRVAAARPAGLAVEVHAPV
jgi:hypothetical protein